MKTYKVSDILNDSELKGNDEITKFINDCKQHVKSEKVSAILRANSKSILCYEYKNMFFFFLGGGWIFLYFPSIPGIR